MSIPERDLRTAIGVLLALPVIICLGAIALFDRMTPAIEHIIEENVRSAAAVERMLHVLADETMPEAQRSAIFDEALSEARGNVTEPEERPLLAKVAANAAAALAKDPDAKARAAAALHDLGGINRRAMEEADAEARRLGVAGAWAAAFLGILAFAIGWVVMQRLRRRLVEPLTELTRVLRAHEEGETHPRCLPLRAPEEIRPVLFSLNDLLDHYHRPPLTAATGSDDERALMVRLLDARTEPLVVVDPRGSLVAANRVALSLLEASQDGSLRTALEAAAAGRVVSGVERCESVQGTRYLLCELRQR